LKLGEGVIPTNQSLMRNPWFISVKRVKHAGMVLFHKVEKLEERHFFLGASQSQIGDGREKGFDPITLLEVFRSCEFMRERPVMVHGQEMKGDRGGLTQQAAKVGLTRHVSIRSWLIPPDPYFFWRKDTDKLNHIIGRPEIRSPSSMSCIGARGSCR